MHSLSFYNRKKRHEPKKVWIELIDKYCNYRTMNIYYGTTHALSIYLYIYIWERYLFRKFKCVVSLGIFQKDGPGNMAFVGRPAWCRRLPVKWQLRRLAVSGQFESQRSLIVRESYGENYGKPWKLWKTMGHDGK